MPTARRTTARKPRSSRTKADVEQELEELKESIANQEERDPQAEVIAKEHAVKTRETVKGLSVDSIVQAGAKFGLEAQRTVQSLTEQCVAKANELKALEAAVELEKTELERLYDLDVASASVQLLIQEHEEKKAQLEKEQTAARIAWAEEVQAHNKTVNQRNIETEQARRREQDEYSYKTRQERQKSEDEFALKQQRVERELGERMLATQIDIDNRRAAIAKEEAEIAAMKERIANIDSEIKAKVDRDVAIATNSLKKDLLNTFNLEKKELELENRVLVEKKAAVEAANEKLAAQVVTLTEQLEKSRDQVRSISEKALESASGQAALANVREMIKENGAVGRSGKA